ESQYQESTYNFVYFEVDENKIHARAYRPNYSFIDEVYINKQDKADLSFVTLPLTYTDDWNETSNLEMSVMVANTGEKNITSETQLELEIYETPSEHRDYVPMPIIDTFEIPPLDVGENYTLDFNWVAEVQTTFRYTLTLDNLEIVDEVTEENNEIVIYQTFYKPEKANFIAEGVLGFVLVLSFLLVPTLIRKRVKRK
ncbi:MAG: CARDB domain-containing protein, partial [Candidatus Heimdallarchaeota archaeon]